MQEQASDITDLNYFRLVIPEDGSTAIVADGCPTWAPLSLEFEPGARGDSEQWLRMNYEPVLSADGKLIDVVAWREDDPSRWWLYTGRGLVLGAAELERVSWTDLPCLLVSTPAGWRWYDRQHKSAICILDDMDKVDLTDLFGRVFGTVFCASEELERRFVAQAKACGEEFLTSVDDLL